MTEKEKWKKLLKMIVIKEDEKENFSLSSEDILNIAIAVCQKQLGIEHGIKTEEENELFSKVVSIIKDTIKETIAELKDSNSQTTELYADLYKMEIKLNENIGDGI